MSTDATALFAILNKVSKHYELDYNDVLRVCELSEDVLCGAIPSELEFITIHKKNYLLDPKSRQVFSNEKIPRHLGYLCHISNQVIRAAGGV